MRVAVFGNFTWRRRVGSYRRFGRAISPILKNKESKKKFFLDGLTLQDGTDKLSRNVGSNLPFYAAYKAKGEQMSRNQNFRSCQQFLQKYKEIEV